MQAGTSPLLQCLAQLDVDTWAAVLLPKLKAHGSLPEFALTCRQLRELCCQSVQHLHLRSLDLPGDQDVALGCMQQLPNHFHNCSSMRVVLDGDTSSGMVPLLWNGIGRLPHLSSFLLKVEDGADKPASSLLQVVAPHVPSLQRMLLDLTEACSTQHKGWAAIGQATQLTCLELISTAGDAPCTLRNLRSLTGLTGLQKLRLQWDGEEAEPQQQQKGRRRSARGAQVPGCWPHLTSLQASLPILQDVSGIGSCTGLQHLELWGASREAADDCLTEVEWAAVAQLTALTALHTGAVQLGDNAAASIAALSQLTRLRSLTGNVWAHGMLPALAQMPNLTRLSGAWAQCPEEEQRPDEDTNSPVVCASLQALCCDGGEPPFVAFPNLTSLEFCGAVAHCCWGELVGCCTSLREVLIGETDYELDAPFCSFDRNLEPATRVAGIRSLGALHQLTALELAVGDDAELAALSEVAAVLSSQHELAQVSVMLLSGTCRVTALGLVQFGKAVNLEQLEVCATHPYALFLTEAEATMVLAALSGLPSVHFLCKSLALVTALSGGCRRLASQGLQRPKDLHLSTVDLLHALS